MKKNRINYLLQKYIQSKLTPEESAELHEALKDKDHEADFDDLYQEIWDTHSKQAVSEESEHRIQQVMGQITSQRKIRGISPLLYIAASILIVFGVYQWGTPYLGLQATQEPQVITEVIEVPYGQKKKIALPDSTVVLLNSGSRLSYTNSYNQKDRLVSLQGEAFFEVRKDAKKPFRININTTYIEVLGTSFNVKSYPEESQLNVAVQTGKVEVGTLTSQQKGKVLGLITAENQLQYDYNTQHTTVTSFSRDQKVMAWREQTITFDNQRLEDIAIILKRWYNVEIHFQSDKNKDKRFSGEFNDLPLKKVMEILKLSNPFQSTFRDNRIIID